MDEWKRMSDLVKKRKKKMEIFQRSDIYGVNRDVKREMKEIQRKNEGDEMEKDNWMKWNEWGNQKERTKILNR